jgi:FKBP-type peptidyl-prolyl cis-trans isomerase
MLKYSLPATALLAVGLTACLDDPAAPECSPLTSTIVEMRGDTVVTSTTLEYIETSSGASSGEARWCFGAQVEYVGTLLDGTEFDSGSFPFTPGVSSIIPGFSEGVVGMTVGDVRRLIVPPSLAYGATGLGEIPPDATIVFDVELLAVE